MANNLKLRIIGMDPGGTTGIAVWSQEESIGRKGWAHGSWRGLQAISDPSRPLKDVEVAAKIVNFLTSQVLESGYATSVVVEDFILRRQEGGGTQKREGLAPVRMTGLIEGMMAMRALTTDVIDARQSASDAKRYGTKTRLVSSGAWAATVAKPHARDAARHVLLYGTKAFGLT